MRSSNGPLAPKQLAGALTLTAPNLSLLLDRLQNRGLLRRERNPADGRSQHIVLTDKGRRLARASAAAAGFSQTHAREQRRGVAQRTAPQGGPRRTVPRSSPLQKSERRVPHVPANLVNRSQ